MRRISIELVPHSYKETNENIRYINESLLAVDIINIPDISRLTIRSWEISAYCKRKRKVVIPHIRALDFDCNKPFILKNFFEEHSIDEIIVVNGDEIISEHKKKFYHNSDSITLMKKIKTEMPNIKIYGAIDPYRNSLKEEYDYIQRKAEAGFDGFFTQPIFDLRLLELYANMTQDLNVFWGISPVVSKKSAEYWENINKVVLPHDFKPTIEYNAEYANNALKLLPNASFYFMPIKVDIRDYFSQIVFD